MKIKNLLSFILLLTFSIVFSQVEKTKIKGVTLNKPNEIDTTQVRINSTFLLLGTLNDYISYNYGNIKNKFDSYYKNEKPLKNFVDSIAKKDFNVNLIEEKNYLVSEKLSNLMNSFYIENNLNDSLFNSDEKKLSFLLGVYYRNGEKINDNIYKIQLANSSKHKNVYEYLKELNCQKIFFKRLDNFPRIYQIYFQPTDIMKKYFATIETEKNKLLASKDEFSRTNKKLKEELKKQKHIENSRIIEIFSN